MAKKGTVVWELRKVLKNGHRQHYALRDDGVIIQRYVTLLPDGKIDNDYGWKIFKTKKQLAGPGITVDGVHDMLIDQKFTEVGK